MKVKELIQMVNEEGMDIYQLSEEKGFSKGTLRQRMIKEGYRQDKATGKWIYEGDEELEPLEKVITYPSKRKRSVLEQTNQSNVSGKVDLLTALIQLPLDYETVTGSFKTDKALLERMKKFIKQVSLPAGKVYSLAILEFLEKYEPVIDNLRQQEK